MAGNTSEDSIVEDTAYFKRMLDLIPPQNYFDLASKEQLLSHSLEKSEYR